MITHTFQDSRGYVTNVCVCVYDRERESYIKRDYIGNGYPNEIWNLDFALPILLYINHQWAASNVHWIKYALFKVRLGSW